MSDAEPTERRKPTTWLDTADSVIDRNLARDETIEFTAEDLAIDVPTEFGESPPARVRLNGTVRISSEGLSGPLFAWLDWWDDRE
ncbi:hypothetical protein HAPAU_22100 [Halalkalicoccus paucihalophilus]|uniref:Uncharacterized protein n=1 Tax=Halalkalicoccus paucihalophilus TaxID=1008153 RepID=A0A151ACZ0_9EURY|nr:hypothetical protein [Halalkalicoccus paucihalophilus]KYH25536.1 hypothetical protein HAPAU_22100 [Halalkalicoccus paucihalophilus]